MTVRFFVYILTLLVFSCFCLEAAPAKKEASKKIEKKSGESSVEKKPEALPAPRLPHANIPLDITLDAKQAYVVDFETGAVLLDRDGDKLTHPSSMTKIMTAYLAFEKLKEGTIKPETQVTVGREGWRVEGSSMFLNINDKVSVMDLLRGLIIQSGNDASVILATHLSGSEPAFAMEMTRKAHDIGATSTTFINASGLPNPNHQTTPIDLALISKRLMQEFPEEYKIFGEKEFVYGNIKQGNRNPLLYDSPAGCRCDGVKTGHTSIAGYGMVASCHQDNQRFIVVINGLPSMQARADEAKKIMTWAFRTFTNQVIFKAQEMITEIPVLYGQEKTVPLTVEKDVLVTIPRPQVMNIKVKIHYPSALQAPIAKGVEVGKVIITVPTLSAPVEVPIMTAVGIQGCGFWGRVKNSLSYLLWGNTPQERPA
jgi:D-alanyl-D-alanine carboxypeptidase (penicillin-binding protein 5/6)